MSTQQEQATDFWDSRYSQTDYAYGIEPSEFVKHQLKRIPKNSTLLFPAEGEGRNAVYAATQGFKVFAFDYSSEGYAKAKELANRNGVTIDYQIGSLEDMPYQPATFDAIILVYAHFFPNIREAYHKQFVSLLKPGGRIILEGFNQEHLQFNSQNPKSGGPKTKEMLFSKELLLDDFSSLKCVKLTEQVVNLSEGNYHNGRASILRYVGQK